MRRLTRAAALLLTPPALCALCASAAPAQTLREQSPARAASNARTAQLPSPSPSTPPPPARQSSTPPPPHPSAQFSSQAAAQVSEDEVDLAIIANVTASWLRFEAVPNTSVEFPGRPRRETAWEAERTNLPQPVRPGVTYRDVGVRLKIVSVFADIDRIVAEALGEVPPSDDQPQADATPPDAAPPANNPTGLSVASATRGADETGAVLKDSGQAAKGAEDVRARASAARRARAQETRRPR